MSRELPVWNDDIDAPVNVKRYSATLTLLLVILSFEGCRKRMDPFITLKLVALWPFIQHFSPYFPLSIDALKIDITIFSEIF